MDDEKIYEIWYDKIKDKGEKGMKQVYVGDRVTFEEGKVILITSNNDIANLDTVGKIIKIERIGNNGYQIIYEDEQLLSPAEVKLLNYYQHVMNIEIKKVVKRETRFGMVLTLYTHKDNDEMYIDFPINECVSFVSLDENTEYTIGQLHLEEEE